MHIECIVEIRGTLKEPTKPLLTKQCTMNKQQEGSPLTDRVFITHTESKGVHCQVALWLLGICTNLQDVVCKIFQYPMIGIWRFLLQITR